LRGKVGTHFRKVQDERESTEAGSAYQTPTGHGGRQGKNLGRGVEQIFQLPALPRINFISRFVDCGFPPLLPTQQFGQHKRRLRQGYIWHAYIGGLLEKRPRGGRKESKLTQFFLRFREEN